MKQEVVINSERKEMAMQFQRLLPYFETLVTWLDIGRHPERKISDRKPGGEITIKRKDAKRWRSASNGYTRIFYHARLALTT